MAGLNRIIDGILTDAQTEAAGITKAAEEQAEKLIENTRDECAAELYALKKNADENAEKYKKRIASAAEARARLIILKEKQRILEEMLQNAYKALCDMPHDSYEKLLKDLFDKNIHSGECTIYFSKRDLESLSGEFMSEVEKGAAEKNCKLTVSQEPKSISGGFILAYGGIEENCSFEALYEANKNVLSDRAAEVLFSEVRQ